MRPGEDTPPVTPTILVVDDDAAVRSLLCDVLEAEGYAVRGAEDGFAALRQVQSDRPACVVLDIMMPGLDGHAVLTRLRESDAGRRVPVVMLTAAADDAHAWRAWTEGADYFLAKPFEPDDLLDYLGSLFASYAA